MTQPDADALPLVVPVSEILTRLRLPDPPDDPVEEIVTDAILNAQAEVEGYLGRNITPMTFVQTGCIPYPEGWRLPERPVLSITSAVAETDPLDPTYLTGRYTVTYVAGIDAREPQYNPIRRYVKAATLNDGAVVALWQQAQGKAARRIRSVSVEGQSESFEYLTPTGGSESRTSQTGSAIAAIDTAGIGKPVLKSLDRWRLAKRRAFQRPGRTSVDRALNG